MDTISVDEAHTQLNHLIDETAAVHKPVLITGQRANAVLISQEDWNAIQETLYLLSIPSMRESIHEGMVTPVEECDNSASFGVSSFGRRKDCKNPEDVDSL
ncbi:type II toxin-antitoxin system prevent-host-death family antitoxin [Iningainema tapete]|uniref:Antitoxin n=1 Tax=Iningainema tapete BLCC-T55 TaxID=2748662 RepID=A0A8J7C0M2_9CYAN|nr:type II toxin-antitoxin system Phd/YefM family antitoxin [Iningainema tapete BLCC-T55]